MIYIAGISIALFISALLLNKKNKSKSDMILLGWMILIAVHLYLFHINFTEHIYQSPHLLGLHFPLPLFHGIFLYYYVSAVTNQFPKKNWCVLLHLAPIILSYLYLIPFFLLSGAQKIEVFENEGKGYETFMAIGISLIYISGIIYVLWSSILLKRHKKNILIQFSNIEEIDLRWLQFLIYGLGIIWSILIFTNNDIYIFMGVSVFVILIGFFGIQQKDIFSSQNLVLKRNQRRISKKENKKTKYIKSGLTDKLAEDTYKNLMQLMTEEEYYKENNLSLNDLASKLNIHPNYLSEIINKKEERNFYDFINDFRVEEFKRLINIPENQQFTLLALAYDCGFNSKSSFNRYFKKHTGKTPSEYLKSVVK